MLDMGRNRHRGNGEAHALPLAAARAANRVAHHQQLGNIPGTKMGATKGLSHAELALDRGAARHLLELWLPGCLGSPHRP